jgi:hypothetical protein
MRLRAAVITTGLSVSVPALARAQNSDHVFFSDDAALTSGAVGAVPGDTGALWYNPAGLGSIHRARVSASGSAFGLRVRQIDDALVTRIGEADSRLDLDSIDFITTPSAVCAIFGVHDRVTLGAGLYVTQRDIRTADDADKGRRVGDDLGSRLDQRIDLASTYSKYHGGLGIGVVAHESFRVGLGLFATYQAGEGTAQYTIGIRNDSAKAVETATLKTDGFAVGFQPAAGLQWDITEDVHLALTARAPDVQIYAAAESVVTGVVALSGSVADYVIDDEQTEPEGLELLAPARFALSAAFDPDPLVWIGLEVDVQTPIKNEFLQIDRQTTVNGRIGARWQINDDIAIGGGAFTDLATDRELGSTVGNARVHYIGGTFGGSLMTPLALVDNPKKDALVLVTTLAMRYAAGFGHARTLETDGVDVDEKTTDVLFHDVMPYTGSAILF